MKKIYVLIAIVLMSITSISCTADSVINDVPAQQAEGDTGGQNGVIPPPSTKPSTP